MRHSVALVGLLALAGCSSQPMRSTAPEQMMAVSDVAADPAAMPAVAPAAAGGRDSAVPVAAPQIAYTYSYGYTLPVARIAEVQQRHVRACDALGAARCRVVKLERSAGDGEYGTATLALKVDSRIARGFGDRLGAMVGEAGGETSASEVTAEDLSKQIVDTEARVRAKQALADRLMVLLQTRNGRVGELVEAERAFAQAQEELDAARTWLAQTRGRVAQSDIAISYTSNAPLAGGFWAPVRDAIGSAGRTFGGSLGGAISFTLIALPWIALLTLAIWLLRRIGWVRRLRLPWPQRWRRGKPDQDAGARNASAGPDAA